LIFAAIFTLLRTMSSPYIKRFEMVTKGVMEEIAGADESYRIKFAYENRPCEILELKHTTKEGFKKVYNSFVLMKAKAETSFTLRIDDVLSKVNVAGVLEDVLRERPDNSAYEINVRPLGDFFKDFRVFTNDQAKAEKFLTDPEVLSVLALFKAQFSAYGFLMSLVINKGVLILDYSLSERLLNELVFNPRNILEHARLLNTLAGHIEAKPVG
jgi:hypothetical protein